MAGVPRVPSSWRRRDLLRSDRTRPGDVVTVLHYFGLGRHLVIDAVVSTVYRNTILSAASTIPGHVAKMAEDKKFAAEKASDEPVSSKYMVAIRVWFPTGYFPLQWKMVAHWDWVPVHICRRFSRPLRSILWRKGSSAPQRPKQSLLPHSSYAGFAYLEFGCGAGSTVSLLGCCMLACLGRSDLRLHMPAGILSPPQASSYSFSLLKRPSLVMPSVMPTFLVIFYFEN